MPLTLVQRPWHRTKVQRIIVRYSVQEHADQSGRVICRAWYRKGWACWGHSAVHETDRVALQGKIRGGERMVELHYRDMTIALESSSVCMSALLRHCLPSPCFTVTRTGIAQPSRLWRRYGSPSSAC